MITKIPVTLWDRLISSLFPAHCLLCGETVPVDRLFCEACVRSLPEQPCRRRIPMPGGGELPVAAPFPYEMGFRTTLHQYKFKGRRRLAKPIGLLMADTAKLFPDSFHCVTYVPLHPKNRKARGYDQSELLARYLGKALDLPVLELLEKARKTDTQHELKAAQRMENVRGAYRCHPKTHLDRQSVLLVDDIVTTGSTLRECAAALYDAGAWSVCALCAASAQRGAPAGPAT